MVEESPWPFDLAIDTGDGTGWHGLMLTPTQAGLLVARQSDFLGEVAPTSYEYGAAKPDEETTFVFGRLVGGMGEKIQSSATSKRYYYADGVDCSIGGMPRLAPLFEVATLPAPLAGDAGVHQFVVGPGASQDQLFCLRGRAVYALVGGVWGLSHDFGALNYPNQAVTYRGVAGTRGLWVATALGELWKFDGTGWAQAIGVPRAEYVERVGRSLYIGAINSVHVAQPGIGTNDPLSPASWGGAIQVGDSGGSISYLRAVDDVLFIFKWDGVFTLNADGSDNDLFPELRPQSATTNGRNAVAWRDAVWFGYGDAYYSLSPGADMTPIGPERLVENDSPIRGLPVSGSAHGDWFLYLGIHNPLSLGPQSHLLKYGTWSPQPSGEAPATYRFDEVWNGALASWPKQLTRLDVIHLGGEATLWVGFADGSVESTALPARTPDPTGDPRCRFRASGFLYWPLHDAVFGADRKAFHGATVLAPAIGSGQSAALHWRTSTGAAYDTLTPFTANGQRAEFPDLTTGAARDLATGLQLDARTFLLTTDPQYTPVLEGIALHEAVRPAAGDAAPRLSFTATIRAANRVVRRDGIVSLNRAEDIIARARAAAAAAGHVRVRLPNGTIAGVAAVEYAEALAAEAGRDGLESDLTVRFIQFRAA